MYLKENSTRLQWYSCARYKTPGPLVLFRYSGSSNLLEALTKGAMDAARVTMSVVVALLLYLALAEFISATLVWFGDRVDVPNFTFEVSTATYTLHFSQ